MLPDSSSLAAFLATKPSLHVVQTNTPNICQNNLKSHFLTCGTWHKWQMSNNCVLLKSPVSTMLLLTSDTALFSLALVSDTEPDGLQLPSDVLSESGAFLWIAALADLCRKCLQTSACRGVPTTLSAV